MPDQLVALPELVPAASVDIDRQQTGSLTPYRLEVVAPTDCQGQVTVAGILSYGDTDLLGVAVEHKAQAHDVLLRRGIPRTETEVDGLRQVEGASGCELDDAAAGCHVVLHPRGSVIRVVVRNGRADATLAPASDTIGG